MLNCNTSILRSPPKMVVRSHLKEPEFESSTMKLFFIDKKSLILIHKRDDEFNSS